MFGTSSQDALQQRGAWWRERELAIALFLGVLTYCVRLDALPLFGEEPRRALIAREMVESGDWLVPGTQRQFLPSRPPLQNWMIAILGLVTGSFDIWSARIPSVVFTFATAVLIYGYLRQQTGRLGSSSAAISYLTMTLVMEFGRSAETEAVFSLFVACSLLLWHWGWIKKWSPSRMWMVGYFFAALGMLTKGLQAPFYFVGATWLFLVATGDWRLIFTRAQLAGIALFVAIVGVWQVPFMWYRGLSDTWYIYFGDVFARFVERDWRPFFEHLVLFPLEVFFVRLMPWSLILLAYGYRPVRESLGVQRQTVFFLAVCIAFSFVSVWLPTGSKARYYMPLFPCFALLIGIAIDRIAQLQRDQTPVNLWGGYVKLMTYLMLGSAAVIAEVSLWQPNLRIALPVMGAIAYAIASTLLAWVAWKSLKVSSDRAMFRGVVSIAAFLALVQISLIVTVQQRRCEDIAGHVAEVKQLIPADTQLVSLGPVHHAFVYFYETPIPIVTMPITTPSEEIEYFCLHTYGCDPPDLPFEWKEVAVVSCDRFKSRSTAKDRIFVGRRVPVEHISLRSEEPSAAH